MAHVLNHCSVNHFLSSTADHVSTSGGESSRPEESHDLASPRNNASGKEAMSPDIVLEGSDTTMVSQMLCFSIVY